MAVPQTLSPNGQSAKRTWRCPQRLDSGGLTHAPAGNTPAVVTMAAAAAPNVVNQIIGGYDAAPTGGSVKVEIGGTIVLGPIPIGSAEPFGLDFDPPLSGGPNEDLVVTLAAGGGTIKGGLFVNGYREA